MDINSQSHEKQHAITIWEINRDRLTAMQHKLSDTPKLLSVAAGRTTCSIFKVPQTLVNINGKSYEPTIVSIGPFHHGQPHLQMIEEHKWRFLNQLLNRTLAKGIVLEDLLRAVQPLEVTARDCYSTTIPYSTDKFIEMMVLDGCFIIELFRKISEGVKADDFDPLFKMPWIFSFLLRDLILMENQISFFILEHLFELAKTPNSPTLVTLALGFFINLNVQRPKHVLEKYYNVKPNHLLDLLRSSFIPPELEHFTKLDCHPPPHIIYNFSKLYRSGIKIKSQEAESFLMVNFKHGVIYIPSIKIDNFMCVFLINSVAFEQCHSGRSNAFTTYTTLLDCLINTTNDVEFLCDMNIIENYIGTVDKVATLFNNMGKDVSFTIDECYLARFFENVNRDYHSGWHVQWTGLKLWLPNANWFYISTLAASVLLILTVIQTVYTVRSYTRSS